MSVLEKLTEGIVHRNVQKEGQALLEKWEQTGLLEGISNDHNRNGMAVLLENQAKELLREASSMSEVMSKVSHQLLSQSSVVYSVG